MMQAINKKEEHSCLEGAPLRLTHCLKKELSRAASNFNYNELESKLFLPNAIKRASSMHRSFSSRLHKELEENGFAVISNLPQDMSLPQTPIEKAQIESYKKTFVSEFNLFYLSNIFGNILTYADENNGARIHNIHPIQTHMHLAAGTGSLKDLKLHTEIAYDKNRPDYLILTALRVPQNIQVPTFLANIKRTLNKLPQQALTDLARDTYFIRPPFSFSNSENIYFRRSLVESAGDNKMKYTFNFNDGVIFPGDEKAKKAFELADKAFHDSIFSVCLKPGMALIIDNNQCLHGRPNFQSKFDGNDRWLQRVYVKSRSLKD